MHRQFETSIKKRGEETGPSPVDRGKSGTNLHLATDGRGMPLGAVITGANANDGQQTANVLDALVIKPPLPQVMNYSRDEIASELAKNNRLEFRNFGVFEVKERAARVAQNPKTLEKIYDPAKRAVKFKMGRIMREKVNTSKNVGSRLIK